MKLNNRTFKGVIFDLDGTLLDSCSIWAEVDKNFFLKRGIKMPSDYGEKIAHIGLQNAAIYTKETFHLDESLEEIIAEWKSGVVDAYCNSVMLKPHAKEFLELLKKNKIPFCVATANDADCYLGALEHNKIKDLFDFILEVNQTATKDKPDIFIEASEKMGLKPEEVLVFEDLPLALETAKEASFGTVAVFDSGYREEDEETKKDLADYYIKDYEDLKLALSDDKPTLFKPKSLIKKIGYEDIPSFSTILTNILKISIPAALETLLIGIVGLIDTIMVSGCGTEALAAVSITQQPVFVTLAFAFGFNAGITAIIARRKGEQNQEGANKSLRQALLICLMVSAIITVLANVLAYPFLRLAQAQEDTIDLAVTYFRYVSIALIFNYLRLAICAALRAAGNTKTTLVTNIVANGVNIVLNYCLIQGHFGCPALGVKGAAIATAIGNTCAFVVALCVVLFSKGFIHLSFKDNWKIDKALCSDIMHFSTPAFIEQLFMRFGFFLIGMIVNGLGTEASAMNAIISGLISLAFNITDGFAIGCSSLVGSSLGEGKKGKAYAYGRLSQICSFCLGCIMISIIFIFRVPLSSLFSDDPVIIDGASTILNFAVFVIFPQSLQWVTTGALRGAGDVHFTALTSMLSVAIIRPIFSYCMCYVVGLGLLGSWLGMFLDQTIRFSINNYRLSHYKWMEVRV